GHAHTHYASASRSPNRSALAYRPIPILHAHRLSITGAASEGTKFTGTDSAMMTAHRGRRTLCPGVHLQERLVAPPPDPVPARLDRLKRLTCLLGMIVVPGDRDTKGRDQPRQPPQYEEADDDVHEDVAVADHGYDSLVPFHEFSGQTKKGRPWEA